MSDKVSLFCHLFVSYLWVVYLSSSSFRNDQKRTRKWSEKVKNPFLYTSDYPRPKRKEKASRSFGEYQNTAIQDLKKYRNIAIPQTPMSPSTRETIFFFFSNKGDSPLVAILWGEMLNSKCSMLKTKDAIEANTFNTARSVETNTNTKVTEMQK